MREKWSLSVLLCVLLVSSFCTTANAKLSCKGFLNKSSEIGLVLPRDLKIQDENAQIILSMAEGPLLELTGHVFEELQNPEVQKQIAYAFREQVFQQSSVNRRPFFSTLSRRSYMHLQEPDFVASLGLSADEKNKLTNVVRALRLNLDPGFFKDVDTLYLFGVFLVKSKKSLGFYPGSKIKKQFASSKEDFVRALFRPVELLLSDVKFRKFATAFLNDRGLIGDLSLDLAGLYVFEPNWVKGVGRKAFQVKNNKASFHTVEVFLSLILTKTLEQRGVFTEIQDIVFTREALNGLLEPYFLRVLSDKSLAEGMIAFYDYALFETPFPLSIENVSSWAVEGAKAFWLPIKAEASAEKARRRQLQQDEEAAQRQIAIKPFLSLGLEKERLNNRQRRNPNKRKNQKRSAPGKSSEEEIVQDELQEVLVLADDLVPEAGLEYEFHFLRSVALGKQRVSFTQEVIDEMERHQKSWGAFLKPLNYGFTSKFGQNGVKQLVSSSASERNLYEIRPGSSDHRMILQRHKDGKWVAIALLHKDKVDKFIDG